MYVYIYRYRKLDVSYRRRGHRQDGRRARGSSGQAPGMRLCFRCLLLRFGFVSDTVHSLFSLNKATPPQNRQLDLSISSSKQ